MAVKERQIRLCLTGMTCIDAVRIDNGVMGVDPIEEINHIGIAADQV